MAASLHAIDQFSFPSGHSTRAFMLAMLSVYVVDSARVQAWFFVWATAIAGSRVLLGR